MAVRIPLATVALLCLVTCAAAASSATLVVHFEDGRTMAVEAVEADEADPGITWLTLPGGGRFAVPAGRISGISDLPARPEATVVTRPAPWRAAAGADSDLIGRVAAEQGLDPALLTAMAQVESAFDPRAVSPKGAQGLMQLMPATAARFGVHDVFSADQNVEGGARYMGWLLDRYEGSTELALAGYNAGEGAVDRYAGVPPYRETQDYVRRVLQGAARLAR